jgi:hypothetical protein
MVNYYYYYYFYLKQSVLFKGIKGETFLSEHLNIFKDVAYDFMHLCCEGYVKRFLHCLLDSNNKKEPYYIGGNFSFNELFIISSNFLNLINLGKKNQIARLNKSYARIKVPHSFARSIRDFKSLVHWKANELKVFLSYTGLPVLFKSIEKSFFEHFCLYVLIIRRLCDTNISNKQQELTQTLLNLWHKDLNSLYGEKNMTFTAHAHLHLVDQVKRLGPLLRLEAFGFEGNF